MKLFWFIFILTVFLRFYRLVQFAGFSWDQEQLLAYPVTAIIQGKLTLIGPQTGPGGIFLGPWIYYLAVPFFWIFRLHPIAGSVLASTLGVTTALGLYLLFKKIFTQNIALIGLAIYAVSPLLNLNDRTVWNPSLIPLASLGVLATFLAWYKYHRVTYLNLTLLATSVALGIQAHLGFLFILPLTLIVFWQLKPIQLTLPKLFWFIGIFVFWFTPLIAFDLRHKGINSTNFVNFFFSSNNQISFNLLNFLSRFVHLFQSQLQFIGSLLISSSLAYFNLLAGIILLLLAVLLLSSSHWLLLQLFFSYLIIFAAGFTLYRGNVADYYLWPILLPTILVLALLIDHLSHRFRFDLGIFILILIFFLGFHTLDKLSVIPLDSLYHKIQAVEHIFNHSNAQPFRVIYDTDLGRNYGFAYLFDYYRVKPSANLADPAFIIVVPEFFRTGQRSDVSFGSIGIINPRPSPL